MESVLQEYRKLIEDLPEKIKQSHFKPQAIIKLTSIPSATFYNRMKNKNFTLSEAEKIVRILKFEEKLQAEIIKGEEDIKNGRIKEFGEIFDN